ncbi:MAG: PD-(D/E)XK nuclease family protein [Gammaproteobacteria bacterium]|nr:PD-(D/E)XK nuclease family protein [Gammaproteobacteria bacterium]
MESKDKRDEIHQFFTNIDAKLKESQNQYTKEITTFFNELNLKLETVRQLDKELNRLTACHFNSLNYLRTDDECGLSQIIADLLDPDASHGQGNLFLESLLQKIVSTGYLNCDWPTDFKNYKIEVEKEKWVGGNEDRGRIDIYVTISNSDRKYCLAIENKPYAGDQKEQIKRYLKHFEEVNTDNFFLIYLPPRYSMPSEKSLPKSEYGDSLRNHFGVIPYHDVLSFDKVESTDLDRIRGSSTDPIPSKECNDFYIPFTLTDWLSECRKHCEVEKLRVFLADLIEYFKYNIGVDIVTNDIERQAIEKYLFSDPEKNIKLAASITENWEHIRIGIIEDFFKIMSSQLEKKLRKSASPRLKIKIKGDGTKNTSISITLDQGSQNHHSDPDKQIVVFLSNLENDGCWWAGFKINGDVGEDNREDILREFDKIIEDGKSNLCKFSWQKSEKPSHPRWFNFEKSKNDWNSPSLLIELRKEKSKGGELCNYYVETLTELAKTACPLINKTST